MNLLDCPHNEWEAWASFSDADEGEIDSAYDRWRQEANLGAPQGYGGRLIKAVSSNQERLHNCQLRSSSPWTESAHGGAR